MLVNNEWNNTTIDKWLMLTQWSMEHSLIISGSFYSSPARWSLKRKFGDLRSSCRFYNFSLLITTLLFSSNILGNAYVSALHTFEIILNLLQNTSYFSKNAILMLMKKFRIMKILVNTHKFQKNSNKTFNKFNFNYLCTH